MLLKILVSIEKKSDAILLNRFLLDLRLFGNKINLEFVSSHEYNFPDFLVDVFPEQPDLILAFNKKALDWVSKRKFSCPVVYVFAEERHESQYSLQWERWDKLLVLRNHRFIVENNIFPDFFTSYYRVPVNAYPVTNVANTNPEKHILIDIGDTYLGFSLAQKILPVINSMTDFKFTVISRKFLKNFLRKGVFVTGKLGGFECYDLVIASGDTVEMAVKHCKTVFVLGDRGYGGQITPDNLHQHLIANFQGRIGGDLGEYIPLMLLKDHIAEHFEQPLHDQQERISLCRQKLTEIEEHLRKLINEELEHTVRHKSLVKNQLLSLSLDDSGLFKVSSLGQKNGMFAYSKFDLPHSIMPIKDINLISQLKGVTALKTVYNGLTSVHDKMDMETFVKSLLQEKLLKIILP